LRVPVSWLREYVSIPVSVPELADRIALATCEVERILVQGVPDQDGNLGLFRVGRVLEAGRHPDADRLQLCRVDVGEGEPRQIVCGAWNFGAGATVAVALPGAVLPGGQRLEQATLRGQVSDGMILSERELEIGVDHEGILVLPDAWDPGTPLADVLPIADAVLELETTSNRPDLLSIYGIAREVAALYSLELQPQPGRDPAMSGEEQVEIEVDDLTGCPRYIGRVFRDVEVRPSPPWLKARLFSVGIRPISNVVDVTNYAMVALGNPLHAFDQAKLEERRIVVRRAQPGEEVVTIDGVQRRLDERDLVIADAAKAVALAGIMGGLETEIGEQTTDVLLEAANFEPIGILHTSERLGLRTEGSNRWEKGVDPYLAEQAAVLATELLVEVAGARWTGEAAVEGDLPVRPVTRLRPERTDALTGVSIPAAEQLGILERLGFDVAESSNVTVPTWRARDVTREADVIEEVVRIHGIDQVPFTLPVRRELFGRLTKEQRLRRVVEDALAGAGFCEAYTSTLVPEGRLRLPQPLSSEQAALREMLLDGLVEAARRNTEVGNEGISLFEISRVFLPSGEARPREELHVGGIAEGGFGRAKGAVELVHDVLGLELEVERVQEPWLHPGKAARTGGGWFGELHPALLEGSWGVFELDLATLFAAAAEVRVYEDVISFPAVRQDLAFIVGEELAAGDLVAAAREAAGPELREARVFDVFRGDPVPVGKKSVAFSVSFQSPERTLSDEDAAGLRGRIVAALAERFGAELRT
jgi:phenylalanyl-tRNA synthetase beta chain